jgi:PBSX family phage terminase large subunit
MTASLVVERATEAPPETKPYRPIGKILEMFARRDRELVLEGPADTGKSRGCLEKLHAAMMKYPGARGAMIRKTRKSLTTTAMVTFERWVCPDGAARLWGDQEYRYANGSKIYLLGMDDPEKVKSLEADMIYVQEASELEKLDWEVLTTRVTGRGAVMPYVQLLADMNPTHPDFWLYEREKAGSVVFVHVTHADNPTITPVRLEALQKLTGYLRDRLYLGLRVAAEGMYFEEWDPQVHVCAAFDPPADWPRWLAVDWGFADPFCCLWFARVPRDGTIYVYRELYAAGLRDEQQAELIKQRSYGETINLRILDPSMFNERKESQRPSIAKVYANICGTVYPGMNSRKPGWAIVRNALATTEQLPDGTTITKAPRLRVMKERCPNLIRTIPAMVRDPLDPEDLADSVNGVKTEDHAVDPLRYGLVAEAQPPTPGKQKAAFGGR